MLRKLLAPRNEVAGEEVGQARGGALGPEAFLPKQTGLVQAKVEKIKALRKAVVESGASPAMAKRAFQLRLDREAEGE